MLLETLSPSPRRTHARNGVGLLPKEAATGRASPSLPRSAQPSRTTLNEGTRLSPLLFVV